VVITTLFTLSYLGIYVYSWPTGYIPIILNICVLRIWYYAN
jgi:hypothetical protein